MDEERAIGRDSPCFQSAMNMTMVLISSSVPLLRLILVDKYISLGSAKRNHASNYRKEEEGNG